jgi:hypothetical protein
VLLTHIKDDIDVVSHWCILPIAAAALLFGFDDLVDDDVGRRGILLDSRFGGRERGVVV